MNWLRRNLFLVIGILISAGVMTCAVMYLINRYNLSDQYTTQFNDAVNQINQYISKDPYPSEENVAVVKDSTKVLRQFMSDTETLLTAPTYEKWISRNSGPTWRIRFPS